MSSKECPECGRSAGKDKTICPRCRVELRYKAAVTTDVVPFDETFLDELEGRSHPPTAGLDSAPASPDTAALDGTPFETPRGAAEPSRVPVYVLQVMNGPAAGRTLRLDASFPVTVGSGAEVDIRLKDASLSRRHASFQAHAGRFYVRDEGSTNGILIQVVDERELVPGDLVVLGSTVLRVSKEA